MKDVAKFALAVSAIALMAAAPAWAEERTQSQSETPQVTKEEIKRDWENTKESVSETAKDISDATKEKYNEIKAAIINDDDDINAKFSTITIDPRRTATGMINNPVYNSSGERVAKVQDIILDSDGKAMMVVVSDGEFIGMGKKAAFDYSAITRVEADGDIIMPLTEEMINNAAEFSYDQKDQSDKVRVIPSNGYSVARILDGQLIDPAKKTVAQIDNIYFREGRAHQLIVGFDKILGMGGEKAALNYDDAQLVADGDGYDFQLTANQTVRFENFKKSAKSAMTN